MPKNLPDHSTGYLLRGSSGRAFLVRVCSIDSSRTTGNIVTDTSTGYFSKPNWFSPSSIHGTGLVSDVKASYIYPNRSIVTQQTNKQTKFIGRGVATEYPAQIAPCWPLRASVLWSVSRTQGLDFLEKRGGWLGLGFFTHRAVSPRSHDKVA